MINFERQIEEDKEFYPGLLLYIPGTKLGSNFKRLEQYLLV